MSLEEKIKDIDLCFGSNANLVDNPEKFLEIISKHNFDFNELKEHCLVPDNLPYGRKCIYKSKNFEVLVMNWKNNNKSSIHDHGNSFGCVLPIYGDAYSLLYNQDAEYIGEKLLQINVGEVVHKGIFHQIVNRSNDFAVTLHFYAPPLNGMKVLDIDDIKKSYIVKNSHGAWNPKLEDIE